MYSFADFIIQTGDPTGTGKGGKSIWERPFKDEFHGRIRFNHRGQVAMANENLPHTNQSQFFITLGECVWLDKKHTIFGKVTGNTIYNIMRLNDTEVDESRDFAPLDLNALKIKTIEVLWNPFDDIVPRDLGKSTTASVVLKPEKKTDKVRSVRDKKLLSFEDEDEGEGEGEKDSFSMGMKNKMHSSHSSLLKASGSRLSSQPAYNEADIAAGSADRGGSRGSSSDRFSVGKIDTNDDARGVKVVTTCTSSYPSPPPETKTETETALAPPVPTHTAPTTREYDVLKAQLLSSRRAVQVALGDLATSASVTGAAAGSGTSQGKDLSSEVERQRQKYLQRKKAHGERESETMSKLLAFKSNMAQKKARLSSATDFISEDQEGINANRNGSDDDTLADWSVGKLKFVHHPDDSHRV